MKKIAFTQRLIENEAYPELREALDVRWAGLCTELKVLPVVLPTTYDFIAYFEEFAPDGIVLTGGNDLATLSPSPASLMRDRFEKSLLAFAIEHRIPVMGICRGMQLIADFFGATLQEVKGHSSTRHRIIRSSGSTYFSWMQAPHTVNSYHRYAVSALPECLRPVAMSEDSVIEALEHVTLPIAAQMWHPEREFPLCRDDLATMSILFGLLENET